MRALWSTSGRVRPLTRSAQFEEWATPLVRARVAREPTCAEVPSAATAFSDDRTKSSTPTASAAVSASIVSAAVSTLEARARADVAV
eukprot:7361226-Prymnesium_polylepis.1